jgi:membrane protease YdiL (CAAX protease family)
MSWESRIKPLLGGLSLFPEDKRAAARDVTIAVLAVAAVIVLLDAWLFRSHLPQKYVDFYTSPLVPRMFAVCAFALGEEIKYRLLLLTALVVLASAARIRLTASVFWAIIALSQFANVWALVLDDPLYGTLRYWAVGSVWGWLYWRRGWISAAIGHGVSHLLLDPLLLTALR